MNAIEISNLSFSYDEGVKALNDLSVTIPEGKYTTIIGHNGSGKSTLAKLVIGLLEAQSGEIKVLDKVLNLENLSAIRDSVGIVFQNPDNQFIGSTVADDIAFGLENHCVPQEDMQKIIEDSAARVGMSDYLDSEPGNLSGGQKQRVAIAGILAVSPNIIIFDESTSMLDPAGKLSVKKQIHELNQNKNITIVSITHDMEEVAQSDHVVLLEKGQVIFEGTPAGLFEDAGLIDSTRLELPFAAKASALLKEKGVLKETTLSLEALTEKLCQLKSAA